MNSKDQPSWALGPFICPENENPIITPNKDSIFECPMRKAPVHWEALHTFNPTAIVKDDKVFLFYRAEDDSGPMQIGGHTSRLGLAESDDGIHFTCQPTPVFYPDNDKQRKNEWDGGCEDPRIVESDDGRYILTYTQYNHHLPRFSYRQFNRSYALGEIWSRISAFLASFRIILTKSASIITTLKGGRLITVKIAGQYWMYWGKRWLRTATSPDLIHWTPQSAIIHPRPGLFDSQLTEAGPPAVMTKDGIIMIYNGKIHASQGDSTLPPEIYAGGQILCDPSDPRKVLGRLDHPFYKPEMPFERTGQYIAGTTFLEGLVYFHEKWFIYYGCADSFVGVAVWDPNNNS